MKKLFFAIILSAFLTPIFAQEEEQAQPQDKPVKNIFETAILIDNQTVVSPFQGSLELQIYHRFSLIENIKNVYGIYGAANTRLGLNYGVTDKLMVGIGTTKDYKLQDIQWKYSILRQMKSDKMPISLSYYGNIVGDMRDSSNFVDAGSEYRMIHRLSYFHQLIVSRKFSEKLSLQVASSFLYFNSVPRGYKNANFAIHAGGRFKFADSHAIIFEYDQLLSKQDSIVVDGKYTDKQPMPNVTLGWEVGTATHCFQLFVSNYSQIINQRNLLFNTNDFMKRKYLVGFNITVRF